MCVSNDESEKIVNLGLDRNFFVILCISSCKNLNHNKNMQDTIKVTPPKIGLSFKKN